MNAFEQFRDVAPSLVTPLEILTHVAPVVIDDGDVLGVFLYDDEGVPAESVADSSWFGVLGFGAAIGQAVVVPTQAAPVVVAVGLGRRGDLTVAGIRDAAAAFARTVPQLARLSVDLPASDHVSVGDVTAAIVEGVVLSRYNYTLASTGTASRTIESLTIITTDADHDAVETAVARASAIVAATELGRDLSSSPADRLTATRMGDLAVALGASAGLEVEIFDKAALLDLGCGGLLGVNLGSVEEPRMITVSYTPAPGVGAATGHLSLVGKGIMYDSGGISLKPSDAVHATMKNDMTGAGNVLAAMTALAALGCRTAVTGYLMCTDNMPSGSALKLGDVITMRGGMTVEILNTDAEGRLVMGDALALAAETDTDAIIDIATLTGACMRALGTEIAGVMGTSAALVDQISASGERTDEPVWELPMERKYRAQLNSDVADITNLGGANAGAITAALFLAEFVGDKPWAHIDIAGTAQADSASSWRTRGATAFGTRLLIDLAENFTAPATTASGR